MWGVGQASFHLTSFVVHHVKLFMIRKTNQQQKEFTEANIEMFRIVLIDVRNSTELKDTGKIPGRTDQLAFNSHGKMFVLISFNVC